MKSRLLALAAVAVFGAPAAHATVTFNSLTWLGPSGADGPTRDGITTMADSFTSPQPDFSSVSLSLFDQSPSTDTGSVMVYLVPDDGTGGAVGVAGAMATSGAVLLGAVDPATLQGPSVESDPNAIQLTTFTFSPSVIPATNNQEYWVELVASADSQVEWFGNISGAGIGTAGQETYDSSYSYFSDVEGPYDLVVTSTDIPEPATIAVLGTGLLGLGYILRR